MNPQIDAPPEPGPGQMTLPLQYPDWSITRWGKDGRVKEVRHWDPVIDVERVRAQVPHICASTGDDRTGLVCSRPIYAGEEYFAVTPVTAERRVWSNGRRFRVIQRYHKFCLPEQIAPALIAFRRPPRPS